MGKRVNLLGAVTVTSSAAKSLPKTLRLAVQLPAPFALSDYEPFTAVGQGSYGIAVIQDVSQVTMEDVAKTCQRAFAAGMTVGYAAASPSARVKAIFFDMDATVILEESLVELARFAGASEQVERVTERAMAGEIDFRRSLIERVALLKGLSADVLREVSEALTLTRGIQPFVAFCREIGVPCFMVSGGFVQLAGTVARKVGFKAFHANTLAVEGGRLTGELVGDLVDGEAKRQWLLATCEKIGCNALEVAAVGDGANDIPMLNTAGVAVGFRPKPVVLPHVHAANFAGSHAFLGPLLFGRDIAILRSRLLQ